MPENNYDIIAVGGGLGGSAGVNGDAGTNGTGGPCATQADPLCAARNGGMTSPCTNMADSAGGANTTQTTQPAFVAKQFVNCMCSVPRP